MIFLKFSILKAELSLLFLNFCTINKTNQQLSVIFQQFYYIIQPFFRFPQIFPKFSAILFNLLIILYSSTIFANLQIMHFHHFSNFFDLIIMSYHNHSSHFIDVPVGLFWTQDSWAKIFCVHVVQNILKHLSTIFNLTIGQIKLTQRCQ